MKQCTNFLQRILHIAGSASVPLPRVPLVEISGNQRVLIENHRGVSAYTQEEITIRVSAGSIVVQGKDLTLTRIIKDRMVITGDITAILCDKG